jgi:hypothetical protein
VGDSIEVWSEAAHMAASLVLLRCPLPGVARRMVEPFAKLIAFVDENRWVSLRFTNPTR